MTVGAHAEMKLTNGSINVKSMVNDGDLALSQFTVNIKKLDQHEHMKLNECIGEITQVTDMPNSTNEIQRSELNGLHYNTAGVFDAKSTTLNYQQEFATAASSKYHTSNVGIESNHVELDGSGKYEGLLSIKSNQYDINLGATLTGEKTAEADLYTTVTNAAGVEEKIFHPKTILRVDTLKGRIDGKEEGGDLTIFSGVKPPEASAPDSTPQSSAQLAEPQNPAPKTPAQIEKLVIGAHGEMHHDNGVLNAHQVQNNGTMDLNHFSVKIDDLEQNKSLSLAHTEGEITRFHQGKEAQDKISESRLTGERLINEGAFDAQKTYLQYSEEFLTTKSSKFSVKDVTLHTDHLVVGGQARYEDRLSVKTKRYDLEKEASFTGKKTAEADLFTTTNAEGVEEKTFHPQNVALIEAEKVNLKGTQDGGDYTSIHGASVEGAAPEKMEELNIGDSARVNLANGAIAAKKTSITGQAHFSNSHLDLGATEIRDAGVLAAEGSVIEGSSLSNQNATLNLDHSTVNVDALNLSEGGHERLRDTTIYSKRVVDNSQLSYQGETTIFADHYDHGGKISALAPEVPNGPKNRFGVKSTTANLHGSGDFDRAVFDIQQFGDAKKFISGVGQYARYAASESMELDTYEAIELNQPFYRTSDLTVRAPGITLSADYTQKTKLSLISTQSDVTLLGNVHNKELFVKSAAAIKYNHEIYTEGWTHFEAQGAIYNAGGALNGEKVYAKGSKILNITPGSVHRTYKEALNALNQVVTNPFALFPQSPALDLNPSITKHSQAASNALQVAGFPVPQKHEAEATTEWGIAMGTSGIINGRKETYLEATNGNIENRGGIIRGGEYTQLIASDNVLNLNNVKTVKGPYDRIKTFDPGLIAGGSGLADTQGRGLYVKAGNKVIAQASHFISNGHNYLEGQYGVDLEAKQETHITKIENKKNWYGKSSKTVTTESTVTQSKVQSAHGGNIIVADKAKVISVGTHFISPAGTQVYGQDDVLLYSVKAQNTSYKSKNSLWGLSHHSTLEKHEVSSPTLFVDNGVTRIRSKLGTIDARGAYFAGNGDLEMYAPQGRIKFGTDVLNHEVIEKNRSIGVSVPGMGAWNSWQQSSSIYDAMSAEDATMAKLNAMMHSNTTSERVANAANLGINIYNTANSVMRGVGTNTLGSEMLSRYSLGGTDGKGFSPNITVSLTQSTTKSNFQTLAPGGVQRNNVKVVAGKGLDVVNGVEIHARGNMDIDAPEVNGHAAALQSTVEQTTTGESISFSVTGQPNDASASISHSKTKSTQYVNSKILADKHLSMHDGKGAMHTVNMDGLIIKAGSMDAKAEQVNITDKQDSSTTDTSSVQISLSGQVAAYVGHGNSAKVREHSGIYVADNTGHAIEIGKAYFNGGEVVVPGGTLTMNEVVTKKVVDHESYTGVGISFNVNDLPRLAGQPGSNKTGEQAIAVASFTVDRVNYQAEHIPVVYGDHGAQVEIKQVQGPLQTQSASGTQVVKNEQVHLNVDFPLTNADYLKTSVANIQTGMEKIGTVLGFKSIPEPQLPEQMELVLPARRKEEEEEEEEEVGEKAETKDENDRTEKELASEKELAENLQKILSQLPENIQKEIVEDIIIYKSDLANKRDTSKQEKQLKNHILAAITLAVKAGSEDMWEHLAQKVGTYSADKIINAFYSPHALSELNVKTYMGSRGTIFVSLIFNMVGASLDNNDEVWNTALKNTAGDLTINFALKTTLGTASGPVSWVLVGIGVWDKLFYDEKAVELCKERSDFWYDEAQKEIAKGNYNAAASNMQFSQVQAQAAMAAEVGHYIGDISAHTVDIISKFPFYVAESIANGVESAFDRLRPSPQIVDPKDNRYAFFESKPTVQTEEADAAKNRSSSSLTEVEKSCPR